MYPGDSRNALWYALTASSLRPPFANVAPSLFHSKESCGKEKTVYKIGTHKKVEKITLDLVPFDRELSELVCIANSIIASSKWFCYWSYISLVATLQYFKLQAVYQTSSINLLTILFPSFSISHVHSSPKCMLYISRAQ